MSIKIALDESIGAVRVLQLINMGYTVVYKAGHGETDDSWMKKAHERGALFVVSADLDIPRIIEKESYPMFWIWYPADKTSFPKDLVRYIDEKIKAKLIMYKAMFGGSSEKGSYLSRFFQSLARRSPGRVKASA